MEANRVLDAKGLACPIPIVKTKKVMNELESGQVLEIHATDKGAKNDLSAWAKSGGHELIKHEEDDNVLKFWIKKGQK
jgi:tRNA 2-thiouridine synthesizing protein A